jgi:hypothetical protein
MLKKLFASLTVAAILVVFNGGLVMAQGTDCLYWDWPTMGCAGFNHLESERVRERNAANTEKVAASSVYGAFVADYDREYDHWEDTACEWVYQGEPEEAEDYIIDAEGSLDTIEETLGDANTRIQAGITHWNIAEAQGNPATTQDGRNWAYHNYQAAAVKFQQAVNVYMGDDLEAEVDQCHESLDEADNELNYDPGCSGS